MSRGRILFWGLVNFFVIGILVLLMLAGYVLYGILAFLLGIRRARSGVRFVLLAFSVVAVTGGTAAFRLLAPFPQPRESVNIQVGKGATARQVGRMLKENGLIRSEPEFALVASVLGLDRRLKAGYYALLRGSSLYRIIQILARGDLILDTITIPEGLTIWETASRVAQSCSLDMKGFADLAENPILARSLGIESGSLEGYLFPDTYRFARGTALRTIIETMASRSLRIYDSLARESPMRGRYTRAQIITMASIVEKESALDDERARIAGVFWNRLGLRMPLGADPTVRYALRKFTGPLTKSDLGIESPYNTRRFRDLPPGPICSPGAKSLRAVLYPVQTRELYFVAKDDGSRQHYFSRSLIEHNKAKEQARLERRKRAECISQSLP